MAVYTKINKNDIILIAQKFGLNKIVRFQGIKKGIENTNYLLKTKNQKYILTIFEKRVQKKDLPFFMNLMEKFNNHNINCPRPIKNKNGKYLISIKNKPASIVTFIEGKDKKKLNNKNCYEIGKNVAKLHLSSNKIKLFRKNSMSINNMDKLLKNINFKSKKIVPSLQSILIKNLNEIKKQWPQKLPKGIIHGDLFIDNIFFKKNKFVGFIDFYFSCNDYLMYEIAICINALCFENKNGKFFMNKKKVINLIKGYESIKKISLLEKNNLNILCRGAALRYLLSRIYDYLNTPKTALIKIKDPKEYFQKLIFHNRFNNFKNYYS